MAEDRITRKNLWQQLPNVRKRSLWIAAMQELGLEVTQPKGGTSHYAIRLKGYEKTDIKGLVSVIHGDPLRKDVCEKIFKKLLDKGFEEDKIWKALRMLD